MLDKQVFLLDGLAKLSAFYNNFNFDIYKVDDKKNIIYDEDGNPIETLKAIVWYEHFQSFNDTDFIMMIRGYCRENVYPPQAPSNITEWAKIKLVSTTNADEIFEEVVKRLRRNIYSLDFVKGLYQKENKHLIAKSIEYCTSNFLVWFSDSTQLTYLKNEFKKVYTRLIQENVNKGMLSIDNEMKLLG